MSRYRIIERIPNVEEFSRLRSALGWSNVNNDAISTALNNSLYSVCIEHEGILVGTGRVIS